MAKKKRRNRPPRTERKARAQARQLTRETQREARVEERTAVAKKVQRTRWVRRVAIGVVALGIGGVLAFFLSRPGPEVEGVEKPGDQGRGHVVQVSYDTPTPTSGEHLSRPLTCGSYDTTPDLGRLVHSLEHGAVAIWYQSDMAMELRDPLRELMNRYDTHVIVAPNEEIDVPIVATAWHRLIRFQDPRDPVLEEFVETYRKRGPESLDCDIE